MTIKVVHSCYEWQSITQTWMHRQVNALSEVGISCSIVCDKLGNADQLLNDNVYCLKHKNKRIYYLNILDRKLRLRPSIKYLSDIIKAAKAQILHSHFGDVAWANVSAVKENGVKHIVTFYGLDVNYLPSRDKRWIKRYNDLFESADRILCEGNHMADSIKGMGCPTSKITVHRLGVDIQGIPFRTPQWNGRDPIKVLIAASFREKKGIPFALEALGSLRNEHSFEITIVGDANNEKRNRIEKKRILKMLNDTGLTPFTKLMGYLSHQDLIEEAMKHHLFISPSITASDGDTEGGCPVSLIEMMATGMIVLSTRHCDIPELIDHQVTGLLSNERDVQGIVDNIWWALNNKDRWSGIAMSGRRRVENDYNSKKQAQGLKNIYHKILDT